MIWLFNGYGRRRTFQKSLNGKTVTMEYVKKPGYMKRAIVAWFVLNLAMFLVLGAVSWFLAPFLNAWYVIAPIIIALVITEWSITAQTIAPIVSEWIAQEEVVQQGQKPSWYKEI